MYFLVDKTQLEKMSQTHHISPDTSNQLSGTVVEGWWVWLVLQPHDQDILLFSDNLGAATAKARSLLSFWLVFAKEELVSWPDYTIQKMITWITMVSAIWLDFCKINVITCDVVLIWGWIYSIIRADKDHQVYLVLHWFKICSGW